MNGWLIFLTIWIAFQTGARVAASLLTSATKGESKPQLIGAILGHVTWGALMLFSMYMAGLYTQGCP